MAMSSEKQAIIRDERRQDRRDREELHPWRVSDDSFTPPPLNVTRLVADLKKGLRAAGEKPNAQRLVPKITGEQVDNTMPPHVAGIVAARAALHKKEQ